MLAFRWRMVLPFYFALPFPDVKRLKQAIHIMHSKVLDIIDYKRNLIEQGTGELNYVNSYISIQFKKRLVM